MRLQTHEEGHTTSGQQQVPVCVYPPICCAVAVQLEIFWRIYGTLLRLLDGVSVISLFVVVDHHKFPIFSCHQQT